MNRGKQSMNSGEKKSNISDGKSMNSNEKDGNKASQIDYSMFKNHGSDMSFHKADKESRDWTRYILELIKEIFLNKNLHNFADCVDLAIDLFTEFFHVKILEQISRYPQDHVTKEGKKFWNNIRRFPEPIAINTILHDDLNIVFVKSTSILLCHFFGFDTPSPDIVDDIISNKIQNQENDLDQVVVNMSNEEFLNNINQLEDQIKELKHIPSINLNPINIKESFSKEYYC